MILDRHRAELRHMIVVVILKVDSITIAVVAIIEGEEIHTVDGTGYRCADGRGVARSVAPAAGEVTVPVTWGFVAGS